MSVGSRPPNGGFGVTCWSSYSEWHLFLAARHRCRPELPITATAGVGVPWPYGPSWLLNVSPQMGLGAASGSLLSQPLILQCASVQRVKDKSAKTYFVKDLHVFQVHLAFMFPVPHIRSFLVCLYWISSTSSNNLYLEPHNIILG